MRKWKKLLAFVLVASLTTGALTNIVFAAEGTDTGDRLSYDGVKHKTAQTATINEVFKDSRKGLLLYSYGSGTTATFRETFSGEFEIEAKPVGSKTVPNLSTYTLHFTSMTTAETFSVGIADSGTEISAYVAVGDDVTGIYYETTYDDKPHGYTTIKNQNNGYTKVVGSNTATIVFNPNTMEVKIKNVGGQEEYKTIWCLTQEILDGKRFEHVLNSFDYYSVTIEFTSVGAGKKGELLIYNVNGEDYGEPNLSYVEPMINGNLATNAIVGQEYTLPEASVYGIDEGKSDDDIRCTIFDAAGQELASGKVSEGVSFVPEEAGAYYLYYAVSEKQGAGTYVKLEAYSEESVDCTIEECASLPESIGLHTTIKIPARSAQSSLFIGKDSVYTDITIKNGDKIVEDKKSVQKNLKYTFEQLGTYTISWSVTLFDQVYEETAIIKVDENVAGIVGAEFKATYDKDDNLAVPKATVYVGGETYTAKAQVVKPSGTVVKDEKLTLDEVGIYRVIYAYVINKETIQFEKTFKVGYNAKNLFTAGESTKIYYDDTAGNADMPGVQIEMTSKDSSATYSSTLDLSDNTKMDTLLELYIVPSAIGTADLTGFYVTLTDKLDPENCITIRVVGGDGNMAGGSYIRAKATGQSGYVGLYKNHSWDQEPYTWVDQLESTMQHNKGGFTSDLDFGFNQTVFDLSEKTFVLRYDAEEKAIYSKKRVQLVHDESYRENLVVDFDDATMFQNLWTGFTDDSQVEMTITPLTVSGTATFKIMNVDGVKLQSENIADVEAPEVTVDYLGMDGAPNGKVGLAYPIFDLIVSDNLCSEETLVITTNVTHNGEKVAIKDNAFVPESEGTYQIQYSVSDGFGNTAEKYVDVVVGTELQMVSIEMEDVFPENMTYGMECIMPEFSGHGGSGKHTLRTYYIHNGEETEFEKSFVPMDEGEFTVVCEVADYLGQVAKESKTYDIQFVPEILIDDSKIVMPSVLIADKKYEFEEYIATYYEKAGEDAKKAKCSIEVTDGDGTRTLEEDRIYVPKQSGDVKEVEIRFVFEAKVDGKRIYKEVVRKVPLHTINSTDKFVADYFMGQNAKFDVYNRYTTISAENSSSDMKMEFVRTIGVRNFSLVLKASEKGEGVFRTDYKGIRITLTDKNNPDIEVQFDITIDGEKLNFSINEGKSVLMPGSLTTETQANVTLSYNNENFNVVGVENTMLGCVDKTLIGNTFKGFESNEAYIKIEVIGVRGDSAIDLISINNQTFLSAAQDSTNPELFVNGSYSGICVAGDEVTLPTANAYDVLNYVAQPTVTVIAPDGTEVKAEDGTVLKNVSADKEYKIKVEQLGQYTINYSATDEAGRTTTTSKSYGVYDNELPTVTLKRAFPKKVRAGKTVKMKKYEIEDNGNIENVDVTIYCGTPSGSLEQVVNNRIPTKEVGTYYIYFYLTDENGNTNVQIFSFEAK